MSKMQAMGGEDLPRQAQLTDLQTSPMTLNIFCLPIEQKSSSYFRYAGWNVSKM
jgi:hypothetical protein